MPTITVSTAVNAPREKVWACWTQPEHITHWNFASDDWEAPAATNDLREGGTFCYTMAAKDKSVQFDFTGTYTRVQQYRLIEYTMTDGRTASIAFAETPGGIQITETFDAENTFPIEQQRQGWQAILDNFKKHVEREQGAA